MCVHNINTKSQVYFLPLLSVFFWGVATRRKICCLHEWRWLRRGLSPTTHVAFVVERAATSLKKQPLSIKTQTFIRNIKHKFSLLTPTLYDCLVYRCVYLLFVSGQSFSWTGARNWNFRKLGTEEEEWTRARRPSRGLGWRDKGEKKEVGKEKD